MSPRADRSLGTYRRVLCDTRPLRSLLRGLLRPKKDSYLSPTGTSSSPNEDRRRPGLRGPSSESTTGPLSDLTLSPVEVEERRVSTDLWDSSRDSGEFCSTYTRKGA